jgi:hypothetical protein
MVVVQMYHNLLTRIHHLVPTAHAYRKRNLAWLMMGMYFSKSVHLSKIANKLPGRALRNSREQRFRRFLKNRSVRVRDWYRPIAVSLLQAAAQTGEIRLIIDATKVTAHHQLLMVALAYRRRALPIAWTWTRKPRGHSTGVKQVALLSYVKRLLPSNARIILVGDSEFTSLQCAAESWGWLFVFRQKGSHLFRQPGEDTWQRLDTLVSKPGQLRWLSEVYLTQAHQHRCNLLAWWKPGEKEPWLLSTNFPAPRPTKRYYRRRMWLDEMFGDLKSNGFDLERSRLRHVSRLSRLTLVVALLYVWLVAFGSAAIKNGRRKEVDRAHKRTLSIFRIGYDMLERYLVNQWTPSIRSIPYFT